MEQTFDMARHEKLLDILAASDYVRRYEQLCDAYPRHVGVNGPHIDMARAAEIFRANGVSLKWHKRFRVFEFDHEEIAGWTWFASLVVQRYDGLEPMMVGEERLTGKSVGSTFLHMADEAGTRRHPPIPISDVGKRPQFDGDMRTMEHMIPDLIALFRFMKDVIRQGW